MKTLKTISTSPIAKGLGILALLLLFSCKKDKNGPVDNPPATDEQELITTFRITFTEQTGTYPNVVAVFRDLDGPGGNDPIQFDTIRLHANAVYNGQIELLNESVSPEINISDEVLQEAGDHLFCYATSNLNSIISITDSFNSLPLGITTNWTNGNASSGTVLIRLKHQPGIKTGNCDLGETDLELNFQVLIQ